MSRDADCVALLQWALPRLGLRWRGYRRVRAQVCKRLVRRARALGLDGLGAYRRYLEAHDEEWPTLRSLCRVTISRFYRDRAVFDALRDRVLPALTGRFGSVRAWSVGCASGEEPYTLAILWLLEVAPAHPASALSIRASDIDAHLLARARRACYPPGALEKLPPALRDEAFVRGNDECCLRDRFREPVRFHEEDIRTAAPPAPFHLILCRNLVFTYFDEASQRDVLARLAATLEPGGALVCGGHERLPDATPAFEPWPDARATYRATGAPARDCLGTGSPSSYTEAPPGLPPRRKVCRND